MKNKYFGNWRLKLFLALQGILPQSKDGGRMKQHRVLNTQFVYLLAPQLMCLKLCTTNTWSPGPGATKNVLQQYYCQS